MDHQPTKELEARLLALDLGPAVAPALRLAAERNAGRMRPLSDQPYLYHLLEVAVQVPEVFGMRSELAAVLALWHDLLEDDQISRADLAAFVAAAPELAGLGDLFPLLDGLDRHGKTTAQYYDTIAALPAPVFWVKASDLLSNTRPMPALDWPRLKPRWIAKYTIELANEVLDSGRFYSKPAYPAIRAALLDIQQRLLAELGQDQARWDAVAAVDVRFAAAAQSLLSRPR